MEDLTVYFIFLIIAAVWWVLVGLFYMYDPFRSYLYWWNVNPTAMICLNMVFFGGGIAAFKGMISSEGSDEFNLFDIFCLGACVFGLIWGTWNLFVYEPKVMIGIRAETNYQTAEVPLDITSFRTSSYAEAQTNFSTQNPDARFQPGNMMYVQGLWMAEYGPKGFVNSFNFPTQGIYLYDPSATPKLTYVPNEMTFAENGIAGNNLKVLIARRDPFAYYEKVIYAADPDNLGHYMAVVSLTKRQGSDRLPYVSNVVVIHQDGRQEWLTASEAEADPRLIGLQIIPEWLEYMRAEAYGYTHGLWDIVFKHTDMVQVQTSSTNEENKAPYHMQGTDGQMYWVTPLSPYNTPSFVALVWQKSNDINGPVYVWKVPVGAYSGIDAMSATIKNTNGHPNNIKWLINNAGTLSGETEILEMLPVGHDGVLYFVGYAALGSNPQETKMYVAIRGSDNVVMQDMMTYQQVQNWLNSSYDLQPMATDQTVAPTPTPSQLDLSGYSNQQLWEMLQQIINELQNRNTGGTMIMQTDSVNYHSDSELYQLAGRIIWQIIFK